MKTTIHIRFFALLIPAFLMLMPRLMAIDYRFVATEDHFLVNPANWEPCYPGAVVEKGDRVFIEADAFFEGFRLDVYGELEVGFGAVLSSADGEILLRKKSSLSNFGEIQIAGIRNFGTLNNHLGASISLDFFSARFRSVTSNMRNATLVTTGDILMQGELQNYGYCSAGRDLIMLGQAQVSQTAHAELLVRGNMYASEAAGIAQAQTSRLEVLGGASQNGSPTKAITRRVKISGRV